MSYAIDVNILLYASDLSSPFHQRARQFVKQCAQNPAILCLAWPTVMGYLRMATHPAIFAAPLSPAEAESNIDRLLRLAQTRMLTEDAGFWRIYQEVSAALNLRGNLVPDAHLACLLKLHGVERLYTNDSDYKKFAFLRPVNPLGASV